MSSTLPDPSSYSVWTDNYGEESCSSRGIRLPRPMPSRHYFGYSSHCSCDVGVFVSDYDDHL